MRSILATACALAVSACALQPVDHPPSSLAAAETAFAAHSVREDMRAAFVAAFAPGGLFVRDGWIAAAPYLQARPAPPIVLDWRPQYVEVAAAGDLGLSTGPWKLTSKAKPDTPPGYGQFVSIWKRAPGEPWKVVVDLGIAHPEPTLWKEPLQAGFVPKAAGPGSLADMEGAFQRFSTNSGQRAAYRRFAAEDLRYYREGSTPVASKAAALAVLPDAPVRWKVEASETSASQDLGYTRGSYSKEATPEVVEGWFLRVWRREAAGFRILLDVVQPRRS